MRSLALITSSTKSGRLSRPSYTKATQSCRCCGVASIMLHFVQILNFLSPRENLRVFKCPDDKRAKADWSFRTPLKLIAAPGPSQRYHKKNKDLKTWRVPPSYDWYQRSSPGGSIGLACDRADQTALSRFVSGHLRSCSFSHGNKVFPVCAKCGVASASPEHILSCLRLSRETFETDPLLALDFLRVSGLMDGA
ncbi:hypothetical protein AVEN_215561-1 [Araneus ventricosus]|uniref:Uncharacterized protein n=1 Tax=Araneus ventricosus TaxID=182803 RepID=A0A4Y2BEY1_ARAVE|nr:hypothetical protein AVEN_215561-1 [Araneus ventricosus]